MIVTWRSREHVEAALATVEAQMRGKDELIVIDNASDDGTADYVAECSTRARIIRNGENVGFVVAVNQGARYANNDLLVILNPDAEISPGWREAIERPLSRGYGWGAWQALITSDRGRTINSTGNKIHFTGVCWAGGAGRPIESAESEPVEVAYASGACLVVPLDIWDEVGGFSERLFMYGDDADICLRLRLRGQKIGIEPDAKVEHDYEFDKGPAKWRYLERSRWAFVIRTYPTRLLRAVLPAMIVAEIVIFAVALKGGWLRAKIAATVDVLRWLPQLRAERREVQSTAIIGAREFATHLSPDLDSQYLGRIGRSAIVRRALVAYWNRVLRRL